MTAKDLAACIPWLIDWIFFPNSFSHPNQVFFFPFQFSVVKHLVKNFLRIRNINQIYSKNNVKKNTKNFQKQNTCSNHLNCITKFYCCSWFWSSFLTKELTITQWAAYSSSISLYNLVSSRRFLVFTMAASLCCGGQSWDLRPKMPPTHLGSSSQANGEMCHDSSPFFFYREQQRHINELNTFVRFVHRQENQHQSK